MPPMFTPPKGVQKGSATVAPVVEPGTGWLSWLPPKVEDRMSTAE